MDATDNTDFCITIDYAKNSEHPERVFESMSALIKSFRDFDSDLIGSIDNQIEPVLTLENIETGSLKTWLANKLRGIPDEAIKEMSWRKVLGSYLVKAKYIVIKHLEGRTVITDARVIEDIQYEIVQEAQNTDVKQFPSYAPLSIPILLDNIERINKSLEPLTENDKATFESELGTASFNLELSITPKDLEELVTREKVSNETIMILKVRRPDYLGNTMWEFKHGSRTIPAKILDDEWIRKFQNREIDVRPGDSLRCKMKTEVRYGHDFEVVGTHYEIINVIEVIQEKGDIQSQLPI